MRPYRVTVILIRHSFHQIAPLSNGDCSSKGSKANSQMNPMRRAVLHTHHGSRLTMHAMTAETPEHSVQYQQ